MTQLTPLLRQLGALSNHPGLLEAHAIDSVGQWLNASSPEAYRAKLADWTAAPNPPGTTPVVSLRRKAHEVLSVEDAEALPHAQRVRCVPIRGSKEMARPLDEGERAPAELTVDFGDGATLSVRELAQAGRMLVLLTSTTKKRKVLQATLCAPDDDEDEVGAAAAAALATLFADAAGAGAERAPAPSDAKRVVFKDDKECWCLPDWYAEQLAQLAQDAFRLHVLASASSARVSRALYVDRATAHRVETRSRRGVPETRTLIKATLHAASGGCVCHLHGETVDEPFQRLELRLEVCGAPIVNGRCPKHYAARVPCESAAFPGVCAQQVRAEFRCVHAAAGGRGGGRASGRASGLRLPLSCLLCTDADANARWLETPLRDVACCGARLATPPPETAAAAAARRLREDAERLGEELALTLAIEERAGDAMRARDAKAVWLLRRGGVGLGTDGKLHGTARAPVTVKHQHLTETHGHLFRRPEA